MFHFWAVAFRVGEARFAKLAKAEEMLALALYCDQLDKRLSSNLGAPGLIPFCLKDIQILPNQTGSPFKVGDLLRLSPVLHFA